MRVAKTMGCENGVWEVRNDGEKDINLKKKKDYKMRSFGNNLSHLPPLRISETKSAHPNVFLIMFLKNALLFYMILCRLLVHIFNKIIF